MMATEKSKKTPIKRHQIQTEPSDDPHGDLLRVLALMEDERHLVAYQLYTAAISKLENNQSNINTNKLQTSYQLANDLLKAKSAQFHTLKNKAHDFAMARENLDSNDDWTVAQTLFGITTFYRKEEDGTLSFKMEGELNGVPLFEQLCVLREMDLYSLWAPFCTVSKILLQITKIEFIGHLVSHVPLLGLSRDVVLRGYGCDCMREDGSIVLVAASVEKFIGLTNIPPPPTHIGSARMTLKSFQCKVDVLSPESARTKIVANVDLKLLLPQWLINFGMKKMCGVMLLCLQKQAKKAQSDIIGPHGCRMREDVEFYTDWLLPRFQMYCDDLGWEMPVVNALQIASKTSTEVTEPLCMDDDLSVGGSSISSFRSLSSIKTTLRKPYNKWKEKKKKKKVEKKALDDANYRAVLVPRKMSSEERRRYEQLTQRKSEVLGDSSEHDLMDSNGGVNESKVLPRASYLQVVEKSILPILSLFVLFSVFYGEAFNRQLGFCEEIGTVTSLVLAGFYMMLYSVLHTMVLSFINLMLFKILSEQRDAMLLEYFGWNTTRYFVVVGSFFVSVLVDIGAVVISITNSFYREGMRGVFGGRWFIDSLDFVKTGMAHISTFVTILLIAWLTFVTQANKMKHSSRRSTLKMSNAKNR